ncbi:MAG: Nif3-like dinuclear metal center hexameric protein [Calditrichaeota bacterium]|nr:Nif3-like dinuclear metal center hexameric protein [Calditrichota bacterium]
MPHRDEIISYLDNYLCIRDFKDYGPQGLQVEGKENVQKIVTGVSASVQLFEQAAKAGADMVIVHHGVLWDRENHVLKGGFKKRVKTLLENDITLLAYHLSLDKHPELGNNALAAQKLGLENVEEFGEVGVKGDMSPITIKELRGKIRLVFHFEPLIFAFGPEEIEHIGLCSGAAEREISLAIDEGLDAYITGEVSEPIMHLAKEGHIHFIAAGHYATERLGIRALGKHLGEKFNIDVEFIDIVNPV